MDTFKAHVQYGDWEGTAAADASDRLAIQEYLINEGLLRNNEFLLAVNLWVGESHHGKIGHVSIRAFIYEGEDNVDNLKPILDQLKTSIPVREVKASLTIEEFIGLYKRFDVLLTWHGLNLRDRVFSVTELS